MVLIFFYFFFYFQDATPQEYSNGKYQMGPASVALVSSNANEKCFDTQFVTSEVNADVKLYLLKGESKSDALTPSIEYAGSKNNKVYYEGKKYGQDPFDDTFNTIGYLVATKKPGPISLGCRENGAKCKKELHDITYVKKKGIGNDAGKTSCSFFLFLFLGIVL